MTIVQTFKRRIGSAVAALALSAFFVGAAIGMPVAVAPSATLPSA